MNGKSRILWLPLWYGVVLVLGIPLGLLCLTFIGFRRIMVYGYWKALRELWRGRVIITSNHPSMAEPLVTLLLFFPWYLLRLRLFFWSAPDRRLLPSWATSLVRCITFDRRKGEESEKRSHNSSSLKAMKRILESGDSIIFYPEKGRTFKGTMFKSNALGDRTIRCPLSDVPIRIAQTDPRVRIIPLYVEVNKEILAHNNGAWSGTLIQTFSAFFLFVLNCRITFYFGKAYSPGQGGRKEEIELLAQKILES